MKTKHGKTTTVRNNGTQTTRTITVKRDNAHVGDYGNSWRVQVWDCWKGQEETEVDACGVTDMWWASEEQAWKHAKNAAAAWKRNGWAD